MTDNTEEWGPWLEHDGSGCPCIGMVIEARWLTPFGESMRCHTGERFFSAIGGQSWFWTLFDGKPVCTEQPWKPIIRYRVKRPRALLSMIEEAKKLDAPVKEGV